MNSLSIIGHEGQPLTMSSLEIAELCDKEHRNVMRDIRKMLEDMGENTALKFERSYKDSTGRSLPCFNLPKRETLALVSGYDVRLRVKIIDRWMELEAAVPQIDFSDPRILIGVMSSLQSKVLTLQSENAKLEPKAKVMDRLSGAIGSHCLRDAAKALGQPSLKFNAQLNAYGWIFRQGGRWRGYASAEKAGYVTHRVEQFTRPDGTEGSSIQVLITPKGLTEIARRLNVELQPVLKLVKDGEAA